MKRNNDSITGEYKNCQVLGATFLFYQHTGYFENYFHYHIAIRILSCYCQINLEEKGNYYENCEKGTV